MAKARRRGRWTAKSMRAVLQALERSGQSQREFCRRRGIPLSTLTWWRKRLTAGGAGPETTSPPGQRRDGAPSPFYEVEVMPTMSAGTAGSIEVVLADATVVRIPHDAPGGQVLRVLKAVRRRC